MRRTLNICILLLMTGCAGPLTNLGKDVATGITNSITSDAGSTELSTLTTELVASARNEALGPETKAQIQVLLAGAGDTANAEIQAILAPLKGQLQAIIRGAIDEALDEKTMEEVGALREQIVGAPLRNDLQLAVNGLTPQIDQAVQSAINASVAPLKATADAEATKWKPIALGFAIGSGFLFIGLILGLIMFIIHERSHAKVIEALSK
jgi:hypothetical protein